MRRASLLLGAMLALLGTGPIASADTTPQAHRKHRKHHASAVHRVAAPLITSSAVSARHAPATTLIPRPPPQSAPAQHTENLIVHGQKRFQAAPMPNLEIHDPADALRDPNTGAPIGKFGGAYIDANPVPPVNPGLQGGQSPVTEGIQR